MEIDRALGWLQTTAVAKAISDISTGGADAISTRKSACCTMKVS